MSGLILFFCDFKMHFLLKVVKSNIILFYYKAGWKSATAFVNIRVAGKRDICYYSVKQE